MNRSTKKLFITLGLSALLLVSAFGYYLYNMPHRLVSEIAADEKIQATVLIKKFLDNPNSAKEHYFKEDGNSLILELTGLLLRTEMDFNNKPIFILGDTSLPAQIYAYMDDTSLVAPAPGSTIVVKGAISAGAEFDELLNTYTPIQLNNTVFLTQIK
jgi:hypothetical protein